MEGSPNALSSTSARVHDFEYLYASNTNVSNFVSVKLSGKSQYALWKAQMLCLLDSHNMCGIVDSSFGEPRDSSTDTMRQYNSLVKGWIFGSVSEDILVDVFSLSSAKDVWEKLKSMFDPTVCTLREGEQQNHRGSSKMRLFSLDSTSNGSYSKIVTEDTNAVSAETHTIEEEADGIELIVHNEGVPTKTETTNKDAQKSEDKKNLREATIKGDWSAVESLLKKDEGLATDAISNDGSTILHIAVGIGHNDLVKKLFSYINNEQVLKKRDLDGSTSLHIAAIVGNMHAAEILVKKNHMLLQIKDHAGDEPLQKAFENMHLDTIGFLLKANNASSFGPLQNDDAIAVLDLLVNAISAKQYSLASELVRNFPDAATKSDEVLMAIAKNFPSGLDSVEALIYPSLDKFLEVLINTAFITLILFGFPLCCLIDFIANRHKPDFDKGTMLFMLVVGTIPAMLASPFALLCLLILTVCFLFLFIYSLWWKGAKLIFGPIKHIENKKKEWDEGKTLLELVCDNIGKLNNSGTRHPYYTRPILEAASQNAYTVVDEILFRSPEAIQSTDKSGYDIIQLAIINRSEKIYNLIYDIGERKNVYRTYKDSSDNNILHLVGKLAPSSVLKERAGAALQVQRELQWREEVKKFVFPTYITQENIFKETPDMVFRREHVNLVKEGEQWMKTTAESCSITAALITTIVFAAAITVPGGSDEKDGIPLFRKRVAFIIFAISDAISLFASSTALLVFLSILTARFAENDFLVSLPRRLFIGLFSLLLSTIAMMTAFSATLFIVFGDEKLWMLAPICGLAFIPIAFFVSLQFPLMVDLFRSTYIRIFGKQRKSVLRRFNPDEIRLRFGTNFNRSSSRRAAMKEQKNEERNIQPARGQTKKYFQLRK